MLAIRFRVALFTTHLGSIDAYGRTAADCRERLDAMADQGRSAVSRRCVRVGKEEWNERREEPLDRRQDRRRFGDEGAELEGIEVSRKVDARRAVADVDVRAETGLTVVLVSRNTRRIRSRSAMIVRIMTCFRVLVGTRSVNRIVERTRLNAETLSRRTEEEEDRGEQRQEPFRCVTNHDRKTLRYRWTDSDQAACACQRS